MQFCTLHLLFLLIIFLEQLHEVVFDVINSFEDFRGLLDKLCHLVLFLADLFLSKCG